MAARHRAGRPDRGAHHRRGQGRGVGGPPHRGPAERGGHFADLAERAVVVVSAHKHDLAPAELAKISDGFAPLARDVVTVPYDPALGADVLNYGALRASTQRAWLRAGAAVARGL
ncbi:hypothetical protein [Clavibacter tessellarius]|uniref:hypothetical protein n=1 Tax=Clavibacter tessellarius TaxID=31965 RepID=UPI00324464D9